MVKRSLTTEQRPNLDLVPAGRSGGSLSWAGLANTYFWVDPSKKVAGVILTQILPFADARVFDIYGKFESGVYKGLS